VFAFNYKKGEENGGIGGGRRRRRDVHLDGKVYQGPIVATYSL
jgi:hypothetical protein